MIVKKKILMGEESTWYWYLEGKICISDYRTLIKELEINGATKPTTMTEA